MSEEHGDGYEAIPSKLRERDQWIITRNKEPVRPRTGWNYPSKQLSFDTALGLLDADELELAFALREEDPIVVIDFDDVGYPNNLPDAVRDWIHELETYTEVSRSGTGLHLVCEGTRLPDRNEKGGLGDNGSVEVFDAGQYVILTGERVGSASNVRTGGDELVDFQREFLPERTTSNRPSTQRKSPDEVDLKAVSANSLTLGPDDIYRTIQEYATAGSFEAQDTLRLWESRAGSDYGYESASEADMALCADLAFWCREDAWLMDRCFRQSSRYRDKWDEVHYQDGRTYGEGTISQAIYSNYDSYSADRYVVWE